MLLIFALIIFQQAKKTENYGDWVAHSYELLRTAYKIENNIFKAEASYRGYFLTGSEAFLTSNNPDDLNIKENMAILKAMTVDDKDQYASVEKMYGMFQQLQSIQLLHREIYKKSGSSSLLIGDIQKGQDLMDKLQKQLEQFISIELNNLERRIYLTKQEQAYHMSTINIGAAISILGLIVATMIIILLLSKGALTARRLEGIEIMYGLIQDGIKDGLFDYNPVKKTVMFTPSYRRQLGYSDDQLPDDFDKGFLHLIHPDDRAKVLDEINFYQARKISHFSIDYRILHADGAWFWVLTRAVGTWDKNGNCIRLIGLNTDITAQKQQEEALRELNNELESFTYIASHDLRSPLVNMKGFTKEIENSLQEAIESFQSVVSAIPEEKGKFVTNIIESDIPESLNFINSAVERMDTLTSAILNLSRIGRRVYKPAVVPMNDVVRRCLETLNYDLSERQAEVHVQENLPDVYADPLAVEQLFSNIIENAIKYLDPRRKGEISITAKDLLNEIIFSIADNGRGIRNEDSIKIFDIFRRASNSGDVRGVGMGLAFVRTTIRKMGGRIWYDSELDKGTIFHIAIPKPQPGA